MEEEAEHDYYDEWKILRESTKPLLSENETYERTKNIQNLGAECKRLLEQEIIPTIKGGEEALEQAIRFFDRKIPDNEQYKTGYRWYRFGVRASAIEYLDSIINSPAHLAFQAYQDFKKHHQNREQEIVVLLEHNLKLIISRAFKYRNYLLEPRELVDEGAMGFIKALDRYDPDRGTKFSTYAVYAIDRSILEIIKKVSKDKAMQRQVRIDNGQDNILDHLSDPRSQQEFDRIVTREELDQAIKLLPEQSQEIIRLRFEKDFTLEEIGKHFNFSCEKIRRIINKALAQMKIALLQLRQSNSQ